MKNVFHSWSFLFSASLTVMAVTSAAMAKNDRTFIPDEFKDIQLCGSVGDIEFYQHDTLQLNQRYHMADSLFRASKDGFKLNEDAVKSIRFDFSPTTQNHSKLKTAPIEKPWMDFQVDLSVPKSMIDTTKVRKPENYIRMLPYSIWTRFGINPIYDMYVFGSKKRFEIMWKLNLESVEEYSRTQLPNAGTYNPNAVGSSVVIGDLDFIGFLYNNLNKQGRIRKHNRKHATAWKTYQSKSTSPTLDKVSGNSAVKQMDQMNNVGNESFQRQYKSVELYEERNPRYFDQPDHRLLQTTEQRSRFGSFYNPDLYAIPFDFDKKDSISKDSSNISKDQVGSVENIGELDSPKSLKHKKRSQRKKRTNKKTEQHETDILEELPNSMEDLYEYIRLRQLKDSLQRKENARKDKVDQNVYELEQQIRKLKERQN